MFHSLESATPGTERTLEEMLDALKFDINGLVPAIAQCVDSGEVLMLAWMDRTAISRTLTEGYRLLLVPQSTRLLAQGRDFGSSAGAEGTAIRLRWRRCPAHRRADGTRLPHQPPKLFLS